MNIGLIIFVVSVVISLITALNDKYYKKRQQNQPKSSQPSRQPTTERKQQKGFLEQLGEKFEEMQKEFEGTPSPEPDTSSDPEETTSLDHRTSQTRQMREQSSQSRLDSSQKEQALTQQLNDSLNDELYDLRSQMDLEKQKQVEVIERRAQAIIVDKYLSERAKKERLRQLFANKFNRTNTRTNDDLRFDEDEVLNGYVWSEILKKPKQLK